MKTEWRKGDTIEPGGCVDQWIAGIHITVGPREHGNAIECYGKTQEIAERRRDFVMNAVAKFCNQSDAFQTVDVIYVMEK